jgi:hypothetical protein
MCKWRADGTYSIGEAGEDLVDVLATQVNQAVLAHHIVLLRVALLCQISQIK